jgi:hypothetical protein
MLVTFLLQFMFACMGVQLFKVNFREIFFFQGIYFCFKIREHFIRVMINQC